MTGPTTTATPPRPRRARLRRARPRWARPVAWTALLLAGAALPLMMLSSSTSVLTGAVGGSNDVDHSSAEALREAGLMDQETYTVVREATQGTSVPWQILAVLAYKPGPATTDPSGPTPGPSGQPTGQPSQAPGAGSALGWAMGQAGKPYRHSGPNPTSDRCGSRGPDCFDCSGLTSMAFKTAAGIDIGATPAAQYAGYASYGGTRVDATSDGNLQPGDLVFWDDDGDLSRISHVAFYAGTGQIFDAANPSLTIGRRPLHMCDKTLKRLPYAIRVPRAADGTAAPAGPTPPASPTPTGTGHAGGSPSPVPSGAVPTFTGGTGRFHLQGVAGADRFETAARQVAKRINAETENAPFGIDIVVSSDGELVVSSKDEDVEAEAEVKRAYVKAIASLPVAGMDEHKATQVYETARRWKLGQVSPPDQARPPSAPQCTITSANPGGLNTTDGTITVARNDGSQKFTLSGAQVRNAKAVYQAGARRGATYNEQIALMEVGLVESRLRVLANNGRGLQPYCRASSGARLTSADVAGLAAQSQALPHDGLGGDCDSMGIFQQRPLMGWGTVQQTMSVEQSVANFLGAPDSVASSGGLRRVPGAASMDPGAAAQKVQRSGVPDAYGKWSNAARDLVASMGTVTCTQNPPPAGPAQPGSGAWRRPVGMDVTITSPFGCRALAINGGFHTGVDFGGNALGKPIYAASAGRVAYVLKDGQSQFYSGAAILIDHGNNLYTIYNHMSDDGVKVQVGQQVNAGDQIAVIGNAGRSSGAHLHFGVIQSARPLVPYNENFLNPADVLARNGVDVWGKQKPIVQKTTPPCR